MTVFLLIAQTAPAEPAPGGWTATGEKIVSLAHSQPDAFWPVVAVALPLVLLAGGAILLVKYVIPAWREEKKADRDSLVAALRQRGEEAERDATKDRELAKSQSEALVGRIETKIDGIRSEVAKIDGRVERHSEVLARLALKVGAGLAIAAAFLSGAAAGAGWLTIVERQSSPPSVFMGGSSAMSQPSITPTNTAGMPTPCAADDSAKGECVRKPCKGDQYCCGPERCCLKKTDTAKQSAPLSVVAVSEGIRTVIDFCDQGRDSCEL